MGWAGRWPLEYRVLALQAVLITVCAIMGLGLGSAPDWVFAGGICILAPNGWMAVRARRRASAGAEMQSAVGLFLAMLAKIALTISLMVVVLSQAVVIDGPAFFAGMIAALVGHRASLLLMGGVEEKEASAGKPAARIERE